MATNFPSSLDVFTNPTSTSSMSGALSHAGQHSDVNDAVEALQAKVGADGSAVASSHDYKIAALENAGPVSGSIVQTSWNTLPVTNFQTTASTIQNTGFSVNFTPLYSTSKVLHIITIGAYFICDGHFKIYRGGSPAVNISLMDSYRNVATTTYIYDMPPTTATLLDSPSTTSQITYQIWAYASGCGRTCYIGSTGDFTPTWLLLEVAQ